MTINDYFAKFGTKGLRELAARSGTKLSYLLQLNYVETKRPSMQMAVRLIEASDGLLTLDGLANPQKITIRERRMATSGQ